MILVTVGTHTAPFDRLVRAAEALAADTREEVVIQRGVSTVTTTAARSFDFCDSKEIAHLIAASRVVVCHGADTILDVLRAGRPVVAVPRRQEFGEHLNDHQVDFTRALAEREQIVLVEDPAMGLAEAIDRAARMPIPDVPAVPRLAIAIRAVLEAWYPEHHPARSE